MSNYDLQFTDDIRVIIQNVLLYRKNFNKAKSLFSLMNQNSYYWGSNYKAEEADPRNGRPINMLLANNEIGPVPRRLMDSGSDSAGLSIHDHTKKALLNLMNEKEYDESGFDAVAKRFNPGNMYGLKDRENVMDDVFEKETKGRREI